MPGYRYKPATERMRVVDKFGGEVGKAIEGLKGRGFVKFNVRIAGDGGRIWEIEATRFDREEI